MIRIQDLLKAYRDKKEPSEAVVLNFKGVDGFDVYNITAPFEIENQRVIAGRVEKRADEHSRIRLFKETMENQWTVIEEGIDLTLQDPFYTCIDDKVILGGVEVFFEQDQAKWRTVFYHLKSAKQAERLFEGPFGMKDLRLRQLADGKILVLTRPQGEKGGRGKIGYTLIDSFADLSVDVIESAPLLNNQFSDEEWGGANEIHLWQGKIAVLGHIANFDEAGNRHYYAMSFTLDSENGTLVDPKIIAERRDFLEGPSKRIDLTDVVFSGGIILEGDSAVLYAGISDAGAQKIEIKNPFI